MLAALLVPSGLIITAIITAVVYKGKKHAMINAGEEPWVNKQIVVPLNYLKQPPHVVQLHYKTGLKGQHNNTTYTRNSSILD